MEHIFNTQFYKSNFRKSAFSIDVKKRSDRIMNYFLAGYFLIGLLLATFYGTWTIAIGIGGLSLTAYYSAKILLPDSSLYQYVLGAVYGVFMAQFIYQMHGMFEMHFFALIGSAILITYQKWRLQIPLLITVFVHHAAFSYMQNAGFTKVYFTQLDYFDFQTFIIHILLTMAVIFICGLWAYQLKEYTAIQMLQSLKVAELQKQAFLSMEKEQKAKALEEKNAILESIGDAFFAVDKNWAVTYWNNMAEKILRKKRAEIVGKNLWDVYPEALSRPIYQFFKQAHTEHKHVQFEAAYRDKEGFYETSIYPSENGLSVYIKDVSTVKKSETQLKQLNEELQQQAKDLAFSNAELEQFAYVASHDMQEPLRMVTSFMSLIEKKYSDILDEKGRQYIHFAVDGGNRMRQIIRDLLEFSRVGRTEDKLEMVNLDRLMTEITGLHRKQIAENNAVIDVTGLPVLYTAKAPLRQVFQNLISNGLKYQSQGVQPVLGISCEDRGTDWLFSVKDNGIGIDPKHHEAVFIIFKRLHGIGEYQGNGMGLAVTKKIVEHLDGKIWIESALGEGTTFYFTLPKTPSQPLLES